MITLDTHIIIWDALQPEKISRTARKRIDQEKDSGEIVIADISLWEISMLIKKQRLKIGKPYLEFIQLIQMANHYTYQNITPEIADLSVSFPADLSLDPADRLISATSIYHGAPLITADANLRKSVEVQTIW